MLVIQVEKTELIIEELRKVKNSTMFCKRTVKYTSFDKDVYYLVDSGSSQGSETLLMNSKDYDNLF